jgi:hypothetical protein
MNIFEQLNMLLTESDETPKAKESDIPIHPEMETKEQGEMAAAEKILKLFQKLKMSSGSGPDTVKDGRPEIPDDMIDPMLKEAPKSSKDRTFEKNKLAGWDEQSDDKIKKEVELDSEEGENDEFDDFDYRKNSFGDEEDDDIEPQDIDDDRSEDEKLRDSIEDAIDSLDKDNGDAGDGQGGDDSGANWDDEDAGDGQEGGSEQGDQEGKQGKQQGSQQGSQQQGGQEGETGEQEGSNSNSSGNGSRETQSDRKKRLEDLKKSLDSKGMGEFNDKMEEIKNATDIPEGEDTLGGQIETPTDETFKDEMKRAGFGEKAIDDMNQKKNENTSEEYSEEEMDELKKQVIDGLEKSCEEKGGSALASTIVKNSLKRKLNDDEWKEMLKVFLKAKSIGKGKMSSSNKGIKWGHKNHLWRDAVLPASGPSKGTIQNIYCFVDFSGSVEQDLVYTFLGKVIDMCVELKYTTVKVYGFGAKLTEPRVLDKRALSKGTDVALSQTWDFISSQNPGPHTENFSAVTEEINKIKRKEKDAVFLIFGDAYWEDPQVGPKCLKYEIMNTKYLDDICVLTYTTYMDSRFAGCINVLRDIIGLKHVITTKATSIRKS